MSASEGMSKSLFDELKPGDRIAVRQTVTEGQQCRTVTTTGIVVRTQRARHDLSGKSDVDDEVSHDTILLELPDGELVTVAMDELTVLNRA